MAIAKLSQQTGLIHILAPVRVVAGAVELKISREEAPSNHGTIHHSLANLVVVHRALAGAIVVAVHAHRIILPRLAASPNPTVPHCSPPSSAMVRTPPS